ncbi:BgTH12-07396 [Blumeria graminis f. sp. triticale]|uniref:Elongation of fatty acids protein n=3 Tax=Blumeria graminis TaxID=34373 RepID=A0A061HDV2_BLUGR|nr:Fatty acid elongase [Blumeria graminis f. sp. tritici 96224]CAD6500213.1 BgTH12-07396 [Blumeria graminis f. sp. triticale]VCU40462.1 Bgt-970 [Blumeria graminis f. sp. tritici]
MDSSKNSPWLAAPSIDRPFGIRLWPIFDRFFYTLAGYHPQDFDFKPRETPMSTLKESFMTIIVYYIVILGGRELMRTRPAFQLNTLFKIHNFYLTAISGGLLVLFLEQLIPTIAKHGVFFAICDHRGGWTPPLVILYYLNYLTKYLELLDTVFLVLKKKPLTFLHCYHHGATALLCYSQLIGLTSVSWVPITLNLTVHVVMYWYYFQSARGIRIWWKEWITRLQIIQFVIDLGFIYFASYSYFVSTYFNWLPHVGDCAGEEFAAFSGMGIITSYLVLFISFYIATYSKASGKKGTGRKAAKSLKDAEIPDVQALMNGKATGSSSATSGNGANSRSTRSRKA